MSMRSMLKEFQKYAQENLIKDAAGVPPLLFGMGKTAAGAIDHYTPAPVKFLGAIVGAAYIGSIVAEKRWDYKEGLNKPVQNKVSQPILNKPAEASVQNKLVSKLVDSKAVDKSVIYISKKEEAAKPVVYISKKEEAVKPVVYISKKEEAAKPTIYISRKKDEEPTIYVSRKKEGKPVKNEGAEKSVNDKVLKKFAEKAGHITVTKKFAADASHEAVVKKALVANNVAATFAAEHAHNNMQEPAYVEVSVLGSEGQVGVISVI